MSSLLLLRSITPRVIKVKQKTTHPPLRGPPSLTREGFLFAASLLSGGRIFICCFVALEGEARVKSLLPQEKVARGKAE